MPHAILQTEKFDSFQTTIDQPQKMFMGLNTCQRYWVVVTGRYCGKSGSTDPMLIGFQDANPYELTLTLGEKDGPCTSWIKNDPDTKVADMEAGLMIRSSECGFDIPCFDGSTWKCKGEGPLKVTFE